MFYKRENINGDKAGKDCRSSNPPAYYNKKSSAMNANETISTATSHIINRQLSEAIALLRPLYEQKPSLIGHDEFDAIGKDFRLMQDFMLRGFNDPQREQMYNTLVRRLYRVAADLLISWNCKNTDTYITAFRISDHLNMGHDFIRSVLEGFVSDIAMLSLEPEDMQKERSAALYNRHQTFMERLFNALWISCQWTVDDEDFYTTLLLSPMIDTTDQQLILSALLIANMNHFDIHKFQTLVNVYEHAEDEHVRQRALVGWVLTIFDEMDIFPEQRSHIERLCEDRQTTRELLELQQQLFSCMDAEKDHEHIQRNIMPDIMRNSNLTISRFGIQEKEEDPTDRILGNSDEDEKMEQMEANIQKMMSMQQQGSDIYFGGFRQMKRFPFFSQMANWFMPFYIAHPALRATVDKLGPSRFLDVLMERGSFCESDKYSLALAMSAVIDRIPKNMLEMLNSDEAVGIGASDIDTQSPAYIRRMYLQDLYRFYRLYGGAAHLLNPFKDDGKSEFYADAFFFEYKIFIQTGLDARKGALATYLFRHHRYDQLQELLPTFYADTTQYHTLTGYSCLHHGYLSVAAENFEHALNLQPDNEWAQKGKARTAMEMEDYETAVDAYDALLLAQPGNISFEISRAIALLKLDRTKEALESLYRLDFEHPDNDNVKRVLAWTLLCDGNAAKAANLYEQLFSNAPSAEDYLNAGYADWLLGNIASAIDRFRQWKNLRHADLADEFDKDGYMLDKHSVSPTDRLLLISLVNRT